MSSRYESPGITRCLATGMALLLFMWRPGFAQPQPAAPAAAPAATPEAPAIMPSLPELKLPPAPPEVQSVLPPRAITLREAIALALERQPTLALAVEAVAAAAGSTQQAASALGPSLTLSSQYARNGGVGGAGIGGGGVGGIGGGSFTSTSYSTSLSAQQLVYDFGQAQMQLRQARNVQRSTQQALAQTRQDVIVQVKQAYYLLLQNQRLVEVQRRNVSDQQAHLAQAQARLTAGFAPRADVVKAETAVADATLNLATAENTAATSVVNLNLALGIDVRTATRVQEAEEPEPPLTGQPSLVELALMRRPEIASARFTLEAARAALDAARVGGYPSVFAQADYGFQGDTFPPGDRNWTYGISLQWPVFTSGLTAGRIKQARANLLSAETSLRQTEQTVSAQVSQAYLNLQTAERQVAVSAVEVANAEESLRVATGRYEAGVAIYLEVLDAQRDLLTAQINQVNALYGLSIARAALASAMGIEEGL